MDPAHILTMDSGGGAMTLMDTALKAPKPKQTANRPAIGQKRALSLTKS